MSGHTLAVFPQKKLEETQDTKQILQTEKSVDCYLKRDKKKVMKIVLDVYYLQQEKEHNRYIEHMWNC